MEGKKRNWDEFFARCGEDLPHIPVIRTYQALYASGSELEMILLTGRRGSVRPQTEAWLKQHGIEGYTHLLMRSDGDRRPDTVVKPELLAAVDAVPDLVFEDKRAMVEYWRGQGVTCFEVAPG